MPKRALHTAYPIVGLLLVFAGPVFFYFTLRFLQKVDYAAATLTFLSGWSLLRAGVDITRASLATEPPSRPQQPQGHGAP